MESKLADSGRPHWIKVGVGAPLPSSARRLLERVAAGTLRFRLLRGHPSHEKLHLLSGPAGRRVITGSANLSLAVFESRQHEVLVAFAGPSAWALFDGYCGWQARGAGFVVREHARHPRLVEEGAWRAGERVETGEVRPHRVAASKRGSKVAKPKPYVAAALARAHVSTARTLAQAQQRP